MKDYVRQCLVTLFFCIVFLSGIGYAGSKKTCDQNPAKHPLYCEILSLQPKVDRKWAMTFSNHLHKYAKKYKLDPWRSLAIAMQESSLKSQNRTVPILIFTEKCTKNGCKRGYKIIRGISDIGLFQFHVGTVKYYNLDPLRLMVDLEYAVESHYKILKKKIEVCDHLDSSAWSCYHSRSNTYRKRYVKAVNRFYVNKAKRSYIKNIKKNQQRKKVVTSRQKKRIKLKPQQQKSSVKVVTNSKGSSKNFQQHSALSQRNEVILPHPSNTQNLS